MTLTLGEFTGFRLVHIGEPTAFDYFAVVIAPVLVLLVLLLLTWPLRRRLTQRSERWFRRWCTVAVLAPVLFVLVAIPPSWAKAAGFIDGFTYQRGYGMLSWLLPDSGQKPLPEGWVTWEATATTWEETHKLPPRLLNQYALVQTLICVGFVVFGAFMANRLLGAPRPRTGRCGVCQYDLRGVESARCPECGAAR
jgi:hypothetical protein